MSQPFQIIPVQVEVKGEVLESNVEKVRDMVRKALAGLNTEPKTDEEFAVADEQAKELKQAEAGIKAAKEKALAEAADLQTLFSTLDETGEDIREARLKLEKAVKAMKAKVKEEAIDAAVAQLDSPKAARLRRSLEEAAKAKRTVATLQTALDAEVLYQNQRLAANRATLDAFANEHGPDMVRDRDELELKDDDLLEAELKRRADLKEAEAARAKAEAEAKAAREAQAKAEAEARAKAAEEAKAKADREARTEGKAEAPEKTEAETAAPEAETPEAEADPHPFGEWDDFFQKVLEAFRAIKKAKAELKHPHNQDRAARFAAKVNEAWKDVASEVQEAPQ